MLSNLRKSIALFEGSCVSPYLYFCSGLLVNVVIRWRWVRDICGMTLTRQHLQGENFLVQCHFGHHISYVLCSEFEPWSLQCEAGNCHKTALWNISHIKLLLNIQFFPSRKTHLLSMNKIGRIMLLGILGQFDVHVTVHRDAFLTIKPTRFTNFSNLFLEWNSTCFGQFLCPSSGVFHYTHNNGICHTGLLTAYKQDQDWTQSHPVWHIPCCVYSEKLLMMGRGTVRNM